VAKKLKAIVRLQIAAGKANLRPLLVLLWLGMASILWPSARSTMPVLRIARARSFRQKSPFFTDGSFTFILKSPPASVLLCKAAGIEKGSDIPNRNKVGKVTKAQIREIAETKMKDMNSIDLEGAMRQIEGTARNMGITVVEK